MRALVALVLAVAGCGTDLAATAVSPPDGGDGGSAGSGGSGSSTGGGGSNGGVAAPVLVVDPTYDSFPFPLRPELARSCARVEGAVIANEGEGGFGLTGFQSTDPAFSMQQACGAVTAGYPCEVSFCFSSTVAGTHVVTGYVDTDIGYFETPLGVTVLPPTPDLDVSFNGTGGMPVATVGPAYNNLDAAYLGGIGGAIAFDGGAALMFRSRWDAISVDLSATEHDSGGSAIVGGFLANWFWTPMRDDGQHVYAIVGDENGGAYSAIVRFDETGTFDAAFQPIALPIVDLGYWRGLELAPGGRMLAFAMDSHTTVIAIANGAVDPTWGTNGQTVIDDLYSEYSGGSSTIDAQGRLYISFPDRVVRLTADGAIDSSFAFAGPVGAVAVDAQDRVLVGTSNAAVRLDDTGAPVVSFAAPALVTDIALDATGRVYVTAMGQTLRYADDGTFDRALGMGSTYGVRCGGLATCWLYGVEVHVTPPEQESDVDEMYALRLAD